MSNKSKELIEFYKIDQRLEDHLIAFHTKDSANILAESERQELSERAWRLTKLLNKRGELPWQEGYNMPQHLIKPEKVKALMAEISTTNNKEYEYRNYR